MSETAPIIVTALLGDADFRYFDRLRHAYFPPERNRLPAHLTMFRHLMPSLEQELKQRLSTETRGIPKPAARVAGLLSLGSGVAFRIDAPGLDEIRARLADAFAPLLTPQDAAGWRPHITVQNKVAAPQARALQRELETDFTPRPMTIAGLASWWYRGGPWAPLSRHMFA